MINNDIWNTIHIVVGCTCIYLLVHWVVEFRKVSKQMDFRQDVINVMNAFHDSNRRKITEYMEELEKHSKTIKGKEKEIENLKQEIRALQRKQKISKAAHMTFGIGKKEEDVPQ